jgi:hypothetical protein
MLSPRMRKLASSLTQESFLAERTCCVSFFVAFDVVCFCSPTPCPVLFTAMVAGFWFSLCASKIQAAQVLLPQKSSTAAPLTQTSWLAVTGRPTPKNAPIASAVTPNLTILVIFIRASCAHCVPTLDDPLLVPGHQIFRHRMDSKRCPYEISHLRIFVLPRPS